MQCRLRRNLEDVLALVIHVEIVRMNGEKETTALDTPFIAVATYSGNAHPDKSSNQAAEAAPTTGAAEQSHNGPCRNKRPCPRNGQQALSGKPSKRTANDCAGGGACRCAFKRLRAFFESEVFRALIEWEEN